MRRVLAPRGRCARNVARLLQYNPYLRAFRAAAGFRDIRLHIVILTIRHPAVAVC